MKVFYGFHLTAIMEAGDLKAEKVGRNSVVQQSDFDVWFSSLRKVGRPKERIWQVIILNKEKRLESINLKPYPFISLTTE